MRDRLFLLFVSGAMAAAGFAGCGDGEESSGGKAGTGGKANDAGKDGDASAQCPSVSFSKPANGAKLGPADDSDGDCSNGIQLDVTASTSAPNGTAAALLADGQQVGTAVAAGGSFKFVGVDLQSNGAVKLTVRVGGDTKCDVSADVTAECGGPTCEISKPVLSPTHPELNGVPVAQGGDRVSADGQDYQAAFEVTTDIEDGQPVSLTVDGTSDAAVAVAQGGVATFAGVTLTPDGDHKVQASCRSQSGATGASSEVTYPVDSTAPDLTNLSPADGHFFGPTDDSNATKSGLQFKVCGQTTATDAVDLPASLGGGEINFCVGVGTSTPSCVAATTGGVTGGNGGCVELDCPGGAPFDLTVTIKDDAGNPTTKAIQGVRCASSLPSVQIIEPVDGTGTDVTKHILAASSTQARKDQDAAKAGAQYTVVACTDVSGKGTLLTGLAGGALAAVTGQVDIATQPAAASDNCPTGYPNVIKFTNADLPESTETSANALQTASELKVEVTDASTAKGTSPAVQVWVDSIAPTITQWIPNPLCGKLFQSATDVTQALQLASTNSPVSLTVTSSGAPVNYPEQSYSLGFSNFGNVTFKLGTNEVAASTTEPSGNIGALESPCTVTVGNPPIVNWVQPTQSTQLNAASDATPGTPGWQGTLQVQTDAGGSGGTVTFKVDCGGTVTTLGTVNIDAAGVATLTGVTLPECPSAIITAETSNIAGKGVGTASLTGKAIDTVIPGTPSGLTVTVKDRRATSFTLSWTAPADGTATVGGYQVRVSKQPITAANFDAAEAVAFSGTPKAPGQTETLDVNGRLIETNYYFAIAATDAAGNRGAVVAAGPAKATFNQTTLTAGTGEQLGITIDGATSINGDAHSDLLVGGRNGNHVYIWFGSATGYAAAPSVTMTGAAGTRFGLSVAVVGDIDADGLADIAVGAPLEGGKGRVYIYKGRATWPAALSSTQAEYVIDVDATADSKFTSSLFGVLVTPLGDFDGDGAADFAISAYNYGGGQGHVSVVRGVPTGQTFPASLSIPQAVGTRVIAFTGDAALPSGQFGYRVVGMGPYYTGNHSAMAVSAANAAVLYGFQGDTGVTGTVSATSAKESYTGTLAFRTGLSMNNLGALGTIASLGAGSPVGTTGTPGGDARLFFGTAAGMFAGTVSTIVNNNALSPGDNFGICIFGGGFSGSTVSVSFMGGSGVDVGLSSVKLGGGPAKLYLAEGSKLASSGDIVSLADIVLDLPANWAGSSYKSGPIKDSNSDGYADLAIGEQTNGAVTYDGRVIVLW